MTIEWNVDGQTFTISTEKFRLDLDCIHTFLSSAYWAIGRSRKTVRTCIENSHCFGVYCGKQQIGFARAVSDGAIFAYLMDVFVIPEYRGRGISKKLMSVIMNDPFLKPVKKWMLATDDAHGLYKQFGFTLLPNPQLMMGFENPEHPESKRPA